MTTDITASSVTNISGAAQVTGRRHDVWGSREVGLYRVTLTSSVVAGGFTFDPKTFGFQGVPSAVFFTQHILVGSNAVMRYIPFYDFVNKKIVLADITDSFDDGSSDDASLLILDLLVLGE